MKVLIVEDDRQLAEFIRLAMKEDGHAVDVAYDGDKGQELAMVHDYDVAVLDHMLPGRTGLDVLQHIRSKGKTTAVLMLTAVSEEANIVTALDSGADDYLPKPFTIGELRARVRALGRRVSGTTTPTLQMGNLEMDRLTRTVKCGTKALNLTPREFALLELLLINAHKIVTRTDLLEKVWDLHFDPGSNVVDVHVARLRKKLGKVDSGVQIQTVRGSGFIISEG